MTNMTTLQEMTSPQPPPSPWSTGAPVVMCCHFFRCGVIQFSVEAILFHDGTRQDHDKKMTRGDDKNDKAMTNKKTRPNVNIQPNDNRQ